MLKLRTLGLLRLTSTADDDGAVIVAQPKQMAALLYLAAAHPRGMHRRADLLLLLWPELPEARARRALRQALYVVRRQLGAQYVRGHGREEIGLSWDHFWCDAATFEEAVSANRLEDALALYRGELALGFSVSGAPEFERWLHAERERLRQRALDAACKLAESRAQAADGIGATRFARRAAGLAPESEIVARWYMSLLDRLGDHTAALRCYDELAARLEADFNTCPSGETQALAEQIRARIAAPAAAAAQLVPTQQDPTLAPNLIAILPFAVFGDDQFAYLREGMPDLLAADLDDIAGLRTVDPRAILSVTSADQVSMADELALGRRVADQFGAGRFVLGHIFIISPQLRIVAALYDAAAGGAGPAEVTVEGDQRDLLGLVDRLATELIGRIVPGRNGTLTPLRTRTNLPALHSLLVGERALRTGSVSHAVAAFRQAVNADPAFGLAHYRLSIAAEWAVQPDLALAASREAMRHGERLSPAARDLAEARFAYVSGNAPLAERRYRKSVAAAPDEVEPHLHLAKTLFHYNPFFGRSALAARTPLERALEVDPKQWYSLILLSILAAKERRLDELDVLTERALPLLSEEPFPRYPLLLRALRIFAYDDGPAIQRIMTELTDAEERTSHMALLSAVLHTDNLGAAEQLAGCLIRPDRPREIRLAGRVWLAHLALAHGRFADAIEQLQAAPEDDDGTCLGYRALFLLLPFVEVETAQLLSMSDELRAWQPEDTPAAMRAPVFFRGSAGLHRQLRLFLRGLIEARLGRAAAADRIANDLQQFVSPPHAHGLARDQSATIRASVHWHAGRWNEALHYLGPISAHASWEFALSSTFVAQTLRRFLLADSLFRLGRYEQAFAWFDTFNQSLFGDIAFRGAVERRRAQIRERLDPALTRSI